MNLKTIRSRLTATVGLLLLLMLVSLTVAGFRVNDMSQALTQINEVNSTKQRQAINFRGSVHDRSILIRDLILLEEPSLVREAVSEIRQLEGAYDEARVTMNQLMAAFPDDGEIKAYDRINEIEAATLPLVERIINGTKIYPASSDAYQALELARPLFVDWLASINVYIDMEEAKNQTLGARVTDIASSFTLLVICLAVGALVLGGAVGTFMTTSITSRICQIESQISSVTTADGVSDLTVRMDDRVEDEFGQIAQAYNRLLNKLSGTIGSVAEGAASLARASGELSAKAKQIEGGAASQLDQTAQVASAVDKMSASISDIAAKGASVAETSRKSEENARQGVGIVAKVVKQMQEISTGVSESDLVVSELGDKGQTIGQVIEVINDIAEQTNLLALNAAIEAARAGEHGRGFAVVANEVRELADRTKTATEEIASSITDIQTGTKTASDRMSESRQKVDGGVELVGSAGGALDGIVSESSAVLSMAEGMAAMTDQQAQASTEIAQTVAGIQDLCNVSSEAANDVSMSSEQLAQRAADLDALVKQFKY
ncbi:MAG: methyl-accepting chemotaxis protein [Pseudomonadota bacterium]